MAQNNPNEGEEYTVIIDIGQASTKVGFAGEEKPRAIFPTVTGKPKYQQIAGGKVQEIYVGEDTIRMRGVLKLSYPINRGNVMDWNQYYAILDHIFSNVLRVESEKCNVIYLIPPLTPSDVSEYFARVLFETHGCKKVGLLDSSTTSVFSVGETTGLSVEIGCGLTHITPVMNGQIYDPSIKRLNLSGIDIEEMLSKTLTQYGVFLKDTIIKEIKEKILKISLNPNEDSKDSSNDKIFIMPDGEKLDINAYITIMSAEILFNPILVGISGKSLPDAIIESLKSVDPFYWRPLLKKIIISGGTSYLNGLKNRLEFELEEKIQELRPFPEEEKDKTLDQENDKSLGQENISDKKMIQVSQNLREKDNCPQCGELIDYRESEFCPHCGNKLIKDQIKILDDSDKKLSRKEKKMIKKTAGSQTDFKMFGEDIVNEYGSEEDLKEMGELEEKIKKDFSKEKKLVHVILSEDRKYASYKGAAILGMLPSFKDLMIDKEQFMEEPGKCLIKFTEIIL